VLVPDFVGVRADEGGEFAGGHGRSFILEFI
jgi:hypothetical protein